LKRALVLAPLACCIAALVACSDLVPPAATVNGFVITDGAVAQQEKVFRFLALANNSSGDPAACGATPVGAETPQAACARFTLQNLIQQHIVDIYAQQHRVAVSDTDVQNAVNSVESQPNDQIAPLLSRAGLSSSDLPTVIRQLLLVRDVERSLAMDSVPLPELKKSYHQNILQFTTLHAEHILVKTKQEAESVYRQVTKPGSTEKDFLNLAKKVSIDPSAAQNSGDLGPVPASQLDQTFVQAAVALKPGEISKPVQTQFGWHVIRLVSVHVEPFSQAESTVAGSFGSQAFDGWIKAQLRQASVTVNPKYGRFDATTDAIEPISSTSTVTAAPITAPPAVPTVSP
jgi:foldase protein PrsA